VNATVRKNLKGVQIVDPLAVGATNATAVTVEVYSDTVPGSYFLQACADGEKQLHELEEDDNCFTSSGHPITASPVPNLVVTQVGNPPTTALPGKSSFPVATTVQNVGPVGALASLVGFSLVSTVDATIRFELKGTQDVPPLGSIAPPSSGSGMVTVRPETLPGSYRVEACANYKGALPESDEEDNCALSTGAVQVAAVADLIVLNLRLPTPPVTVAAGGTLELTAVVRNQGLGDAGASAVKFSLVLSPGAAPITKITGTVPVVPVARGKKEPATAIATIPNKTPPGTYFVQACADWLKEVEESSEENNCGTSVATLQVTGPNP
jgi:subtilase family serine protease